MSNSLFFQIDPDNGVPVYEQIARQILFAIAAGGILAGEMIPSVRQMARDLAINPNTVARAYRQLQDDGVLEPIRGSGLQVAAAAPEACRQERQRLMKERIKLVLREAYQSQLTEAEITDLVTRGLSEARADAASLQKGS